MKSRSSRLRFSASVLRRARRIRLLLMDVDGTMTDGGIRLLSMPEGSFSELVVFHSQDGVALNLLRRSGVRTGMITGRGSAAVTQRAREVGIEFVSMHIHEKLPAFEDILARAGVSAEETAYAGDDLPDLVILERVGLAVAVANATEEVKRQAHYVTRAAGGDGAMREVVELILRAQGKWSSLYRSARA
ncbi:MAG TPA: HAD hydrolase family protein [Candidatus Acidoferrales bacterium]|nr:HAD hydrolase family protein [Candidatus Acidoferrales bacterium]